MSNDLVNTPQRMKNGRRLNPLEPLLANNRQWASQRVAEDPDYFQRLTQLQTPKYLWIGCSDSRVPANVILGLEPGEVFVQRNVGNQATHTDLNCMSCLEYAVTALKVTTIIVCGHYNCGAVRAGLQLPSKSAGLVNCWISDIRECRNQHADELKAMPTTDDRVKRLCELNVLRQAFHVATSPVVQNAWEQGQELHVYGCVYDLEDGLIKKLVGPISGNTALSNDVNEFSHLALQRGAVSDDSSPRSETNEADADDTDDFHTTQFKAKVFEHVAWAGSDAPAPAAEEKK